MPNPLSLSFPPVDTITSTIQASRIKIILFVLQSLVYCSALMAAEWKADASIKQDLFYDDNVTMTEIPEGSFGYQLVPVANFRRQTDTSDMHVHASYGIQRYSDISGFDLPLQNYGTTARFNTARSEWGGLANLSILPARTTAARSSGNFSSNAEATTITLAPYASYQLSERDRVMVSPRYTQTTFSTPDFNDNEEKTVNLEWRRQWSDQFYHTVAGIYSRYVFFGTTASAFGSQTISDNYSINLSANYRLSERWSVAGGIGGRLTETENQGTTGTRSVTNEGYLLNAGINYRGENLTAAVNYDRSLIPSSLGELQELNSASLTANYQLTERLQASFTTSYFESTLLSAVDQVPREYISVQPGIAWRLSPDWTLTCIYRYRSQTIEALSRPVESNLFMLTINYNWPGLNLSR